MCQSQVLPSTVAHRQPPRNHRLKNSLDRCKGPSLKPGTAPVQFGSDAVQSHGRLQCSSGNSCKSACRNVGGPPTRGCWNSRGKTGAWVCGEIPPMRSACTPGPAAWMMSLWLTLAGSGEHVKLRNSRSQWVLVKGYVWSMERH